MHPEVGCFHTAKPMRTTAFPRRPTVLNGGQGVVRPGAPPIRPHCGAETERPRSHLQSGSSRSGMHRSSHVSAAARARWLLTVLSMCLVLVMVLAACGSGDTKGRASSESVSSRSSSAGHETASTSRSSRTAERSPVSHGASDAEPAVSTADHGAPDTGHGSTTDSATSDAEHAVSTADHGASDAGHAVSTADHGNGIHCTYTPVPATGETWPTSSWTASSAPASHPST